MRYTLTRDDMPLLSQWINKKGTFGRQKLLFVDGTLNLALAKENKARAPLSLPWRSRARPPFAKQSGKLVPRR